MRTAWRNLLSSTEKNYLQWNNFTLVGILLIIICGVRVTWGLEKYMDVVFWDESLYLSRGMSMFKYIPRDWGPSYSLWYKLLSYFISDRVDLYYFNFKLTTILISIALFLLLMATGVQRVLAFLFALVFLSTYVNLPMWPRVSHFCIIVLIAGILVAKYHKERVAKMAIFSLALLVCSFARPELFLPFMLCFIVMYVFFFMQLKQHTKYSIFLVAAVTFLLMFLYVYFKTPLNNGDATRGIGVFLQHFAMNYAEWKHSDMIFWLDYPDILKENFKDATTLKGMIQANPAVIKHHLFSNLYHYSTEMAKIIFSFFAPIFTKKINWLCLMISAILFGTYFSFTQTIKNKRERMYVLLKDNVFTFFVITIFTLPSIFVCIYAYPRPHYLLLQVPFFLLLIALLISSITVTIYKSVQKIVVLATVWFFAMPVAADFSYFKMFRKEDSLCNVKSIQYIKKNFASKDTIHIFDLEGGVTNMLPPNFVNDNYLYLRDRKTVLLSDFLLNHKFDIIYKTPTITGLNSTQNDTILKDMFNNPAKYGYYEQKTGNFAMRLLIKTP